MPDRTCSIDDCTHPVKARGWCTKHWQRWRSTGDPTRTQDRTIPVEQRFWAKVDRSHPDACWLWLGALSDTGYGSFWPDGRRGIGRAQLAHRFAYELLVGPIPEGLVLDHVRVRGCRHRSCVNPAHLEPVTQLENVTRGAWGAGKPRPPHEDGKASRGLVG